MSAYEQDGQVAVRGADGPVRERVNDHLLGSLTGLLLAVEAAVAVDLPCATDETHAHDGDERAVTEASVARIDARSPVVENDEYVGFAPAGTVLLKTLLVSRTTAAHVAAPPVLTSRRA